jgi:glycosyltransferase involved in cell wall biosynthesis
MAVQRARSISVLVPAFNEQENLEASVLDVVKASQNLADYEILIVDDGSTDGSGELADRLASELPHVRALHHATNQGFGAAYGTALREARMAYFTFVPGDNEVALESVIDIFGAAGSADIVIPFHGTPWKRPFLRRALTWISTTELNVLFGWHLKYYQGPSVYPTELARELPRTVQGFYFATEMLVHALAAGYSWVEIGLTHQERAHGRSKAVSVMNALKAELIILRLWLDIRVRRVSNVAPAVQPEASVEMLEGAQL